MNYYYASFLLTLIKLCQGKENGSDIFCQINLYSIFFLLTLHDIIKR